MRYLRPVAIDPDIQQGDTAIFFNLTYTCKAIPLSVGLCFALTIKPHQVKSTCNTNDSTYILYVILITMRYVWDPVYLKLSPGKIYCVVCPKQTKDAWWNIYIYIYIYRLKS